MSVPSNTMRPAFGATKPLMVFSEVDLPLPLAPSTATTSRSATW